MDTIHNLCYSETPSCLEKLSPGFPIFPHRLRNLLVISPSAISNSSSRHLHLTSQDTCPPAPPSPRPQPQTGPVSGGERRHLICILCQFPCGKAPTPGHFMLWRSSTLSLEATLSGIQESVLKPAVQAQWLIGQTPARPLPGNS